jgi:hypothetical protein
MASMTRSELLRIRRLVQEPEKTNEQQKREYLRDLSDTRQQKWPNTLAAMRRQKDEARARREEQLEAERRVRDKEEADRRAEDRRKKIEKANQIIYSQTDKMKVLRSAQLLSDVLKTREKQIRDKARKIDISKKQDALWHNDTLRQCAEFDKKEVKKLKARKQVSKQVAIDQQEQLEAYKQRYIDVLIDENEEGELIKKKALQDQLEEQRKKIAKIRAAKASDRAVRLANEKYEVIKRQLADKEAEEDHKIEVFAKHKQDILAERSRR